MNNPPYNSVCKKLQIVTEAQKATLRFALAAAMLLSAASALRAQNFAIDWFTIGGGGGTSTSSVYSVSGTIGQPDAGKLCGGNFTVNGGFWGVVAVQGPSAPLLAIRLTPTNTVMVSWPLPSTGFVLQQNTILTSTNWVNAAENVGTNGNTKFIIVNPPTGSRFYRLFKS